MDLLTADSLPVLQASLFMEEARRGHLWVPKDVSGAMADALRATLAICKERFPLYVHIDTNNGTGTVWNLAQALGLLRSTRAYVGAEAKSAGLILTCACQARTCQPDSQFLYHGFAGWGIANARKAKWFAERTKLPEETWLTMAETGEAQEFGAKQALEWGVVHAIERGQD